MENSKKRKHSGICPDCKGNGYRQFSLEEGREHVVLQCETCDSEGEIYVDESEVVELYIDDDIAASDVGKLH
jgi:DnaJ-class molecular chaperone